MRRILSFFILALVFQSFAVKAQPPSGMRSGAGSQMNAGRFYGKIVDAASGKPVDAASVQLFQNRYDSASKSQKPVLVTGQLTRSNGDFSLEKLSPMGKYNLVVSAIGYQLSDQEVSFGITPGGNMQQMMSGLDKDLGNIQLNAEAKMLEGITVTASKPALEMAIDRKVFNVEKNLMSTGGTAEDVLRTVPSVSVDIDGNVTLRNNAPQIFVDGRPSTLTIDQIPADAIQSIELITNPSAKYDASGGMAGIINIVMKKNRRVGYNGSLRAGIDKRGKINTGGDINIRQGKFNVFASGSYNQRKSISEGLTDRTEFTGKGTEEIDQTNDSENSGTFAFGRFGLDYFLDNRNTFTFTQSLMRGNFNSEDVQTTTNRYLSGQAQDYIGMREGFSERMFSNNGSSLAYKHLFAKTGKEITADVNYNKSKNENDGDFITRFYNLNMAPLGRKNARQLQDGDGSNSFVTFQTDYVNPLSENSKLELGARAAIREFSSINNNFILDTLTDQYVLQAAASNKYEFSDKVYAAYATFSNQYKKLGYQVGLRAESSDYSGTLIDQDQTFTNTYPISLFPSAFMSYKLSETQDVQLNYTRRVNRPSFFNLIPFTDYVDSLNISRGNPALKPEFTHSLELSYQKNFSRSHNFLGTFYYKHTTDMISRYQFTEYSDITKDTVIVNSYENANQSYSYGVELTSYNAFAPWVEVTSNLNLYNSVIDGGNIEEGLRNEQFSYYAKLNTTFRLPSSFSIQLTGEYQSKTAVPVNTGGGRGGGWMGPQASTTQGFIRPNYGVDIAIKKDFLKNKMASATLSFSDIFRTRLYDAYSVSNSFFQNTSRRRDPQFIRLNLSYRFGKFDANLFKRKNSRGGMDGMQDVQM